MLQKNEIANMALGHLASTLSVTDLDTENTIVAKIIRRHLRTSLDTFLEAHPWSFASQELALAFSQDNPSKNFAYEYLYPADCLVIRQIAPEGIFSEYNLYEDQKHKWKEMNIGATTRVWCNVQFAWAEYTTRMSEDVSFPTHFGRGLAYQLALDIGKSVVTNNWAKVKELLMADAATELTRAIAYDLGRQPQKMDAPNPLLTARWQ